MNILSTFIFLVAYREFHAVSSVTAQYIYSVKNANENKGLGYASADWRYTHKLLCFQGNSLCRLSVPYCLSLSPGFLGLLKLRYTAGLLLVVAVKLSFGNRLDTSLFCFPLKNTDHQQRTLCDPISMSLWSEFLTVSGRIKCEREVLYLTTPPIVKFK
jgi:hypothetical protein